MCFGNRSHRCFNRWGLRSAPVKKHMKVDMVADMKVDMEVDLVVGKVVKRVAHMVADIDFSIIFWALLGEFFLYFPVNFLIFR